MPTIPGATRITLNNILFPEAGFSAHLSWPVASEVVRQAACSVLTVRI